MGFSKELFMQEREFDAALVSVNDVVQTGYEAHKMAQKTTIITSYQIGYPCTVTGVFITLSSRAIKAQAEQEFRRIYNSSKEYRKGNKVLHLKAIERTINIK